MKGSTLSVICALGGMLFEAPAYAVLIADESFDRDVMGVHIVAQPADVHRHGSYGALSGAPFQPGDDQTSIIYNSSTGEVAVDAPAGTDLTSINIDSAACVFTGAPAQNLGGSFDNDSDCNIFKATFGSSFGSLSFGNVAQTGLSFDFLVNDLTVVGSLAGGGGLGAVDGPYLPEPSTSILMAFGLVPVAARGFRRAVTK